MSRSSSVNTALNSFFQRCLQHEDGWSRCLKTVVGVLSSGQKLKDIPISPLVESLLKQERWQEAMKIFEQLSSSPSSSSQSQTATMNINTNNSLLVAHSDAFRSTFEMALQKWENKNNNSNEKQEADDERNNNDSSDDLLKNTLADVVEQNIAHEQQQQQQQKEEGDNNNGNSSNSSSKLTPEMWSSALAILVGMQQELSSPSSSSILTKNKQNNPSSLSAKQQKEKVDELVSKLNSMIEVDSNNSNNNNNDNDNNNSNNTKKQNPKSHSEECEDLEEEFLSIQNDNNKKEENDSQKKKKNYFSSHQQHHQQQQSPAERSAILRSLWERAEWDNLKSSSGIPLTAIESAAVSSSSSSSSYNKNMHFSQQKQQNFNLITNKSSELAGAIRRMKVTWVEALTTLDAANKTHLIAESNDVLVLLIRHFSSFSEQNNNNQGIVMLARATSSFRALMQSPVLVVRTLSPSIRCLVEAGELSLAVKCLENAFRAWDGKYFDEVLFSALNTLLNALVVNNNKTLFPLSLSHHQHNNISRNKKKQKTTESTEEEEEEKQQQQEIETENNIEEDLAAIVQLVKIIERASYAQDIPISSLPVVNFAVRKRLVELFLIAHKDYYYQQHSNSSSSVVSSSSQPLLLDWNATIGWLLEAASYLSVSSQEQQQENFTTANTKLNNNNSSSNDEESQVFYAVSLCLHWFVELAEKNISHNDSFSSSSSSSSSLNLRTTKHHNNKKQKPLPERGRRELNNAGTKLGALIANRSLMMLSSSSSSSDNINNSYTTSQLENNSNNDNFSAAGTAELARSLWVFVSNRFFPIDSKGAASAEFSASSRGVANGFLMSLLNFLVNSSSSGGGGGSNIQNETSSSQQQLHQHQQQQRSVHLHQLPLRNFLAYCDDPVLSSFLTCSESKEFVSWQTICDLQKSRGIVLFSQKVVEALKSRQIPTSSDAEVPWRWALASANAQLTTTSSSSSSSSTSVETANMMNQDSSSSSSSSSTTKMKTTKLELNLIDKLSDPNIAVYSEELAQEFINTSPIFTSEKALVLATKQSKIIQSSPTAALAAFFALRNLEKEISFRGFLSIANALRRCSSNHGGREDLAIAFLVCRRGNMSIDTIAVDFGVEIVSPLLLSARPTVEAFQLPERFYEQCVFSLMRAQIFVGGWISDSAIKRNSNVGNDNNENDKKHSNKRTTTTRGRRNSSSSSGTTTTTIKQEFERLRQAALSCGTDKESRLKLFGLWKEHRREMYPVWMLEPLPALGAMNSNSNNQNSESLSSSSSAPAFLEALRRWQRSLDLNYGADIVIELACILRSAFIAHSILGVFVYSSSCSPLRGNNISSSGSGNNNNNTKSIVADVDELVRNAIAIILSVEDAAAISAFTMILFPPVKNTTTTNNNNSQQKEDILSNSQEWKTSFLLPILEALSATICRILHIQSLSRTAGSKRLEMLRDAAMRVHAITVEQHVDTTYANLLPRLFFPENKSDNDNNQRFKFIQDSHVAEIVPIPRAYTSSTTKYNNNSNSNNSNNNAGDNDNNNSITSSSSSSTSPLYQAISQCTSNLPATVYLGVLGSLFVQFSTGTFASPLPRIQHKSDFLHLTERVCDWIQKIEIVSSSCLYNSQNDNQNFNSTAVGNKTTKSNSNNTNDVVVSGFASFSSLASNLFSSNSMMSTATATATTSISLRICARFSLLIIKSILTKLTPLPITGEASKVLKQAKQLQQILEKLVKQFSSSSSSHFLLENNNNFEQFVTNLETLQNDAEIISEDVDRCSMLPPKAWISIVTALSLSLSSSSSSSSQNQEQTTTTTTTNSTSSKKKIQEELEETKYLNHLTKNLSPFYTCNILVFVACLNRPISNQSWNILHKSVPISPQLAWIIFERSCFFSSSQQQQQQNNYNNNKILVANPTSVFDSVARSDIDVWRCVLQLFSQATAGSLLNSKSAVVSSSYNKTQRSILVELVARHRIPFIPALQIISHIATNVIIGSHNNNARSDAAGGSSDENNNNTTTLLRIITTAKRMFPPESAMYINNAIQYASERVLSSSSSFSSTSTSSSSLSEKSQLLLQRWTAHETRGQFERRLVAREMRGNTSNKNIINRDSDNKKSSNNNNQQQQLLPRGSLSIDTCKIDPVAFVQALVPAGNETEANKILQHSATPEKYSKLFKSWIDATTTTTTISSFSSSSSTTTSSSKNKMEKNILAQKLSQLEDRVLAGEIEKNSERALRTDLIRDFILNNNNNNNNTSLQKQQGETGIELVVREMHTIQNEMNNMLKLNSNNNQKNNYRGLLRILSALSNVAQSSSNNNNNNNSSSSSFQNQKLHLLPPRTVLIAAITTSCFADTLVHEAANRAKIDYNTAVASASNSLFSFSSSSTSSQTNNHNNQQHQLSISNKSFTDETWEKLGSWISSHLIWIVEENFQKTWRSNFPNFGFSSSPSSSLQNNNNQHNNSSINASINSSLLCVSLLRLLGLGVSSGEATKTETTQKKLLHLAVNELVRCSEYEIRQINELIEEVLWKRIIATCCGNLFKEIQNNNNNKNQSNNQKATNQIFEETRDLLILVSRCLPYWELLFSSSSSSSSNSEHTATKTTITTSSFCDEVRIRIRDLVASLIFSPYHYQQQQQQQQQQKSSKKSSTSSQILTLEECVILIHHSAKIPGMLSFNNNFQLRNQIISKRVILGALIRRLDFEVKTYSESLVEFEKNRSKNQNNNAEAKNESVAAAAAAAQQLQLPPTIDIRPLVDSKLTSVPLWHAAMVLLDHVIATTSSSKNQESSSSSSALPQATIVSRLLRQSSNLSSFSSSSSSLSSSNKNFEKLFSKSIPNWEMQLRLLSKFGVDTDNNNPQQQQKEENKSITSLSKQFEHISLLAENSIVALTSVPELSKEQTDSLEHVLIIAAKNSKNAASVLSSNENNNNNNNKQLQNQLIPLQTPAAFSRVIRSKYAPSWERSLRLLSHLRPRYHNERDFVSKLSDIIDVAVNKRELNTVAAIVDAATTSTSSSSSSSSQQQQQASSSSTTSYKKSYDLSLNRKVVTNIWKLLQQVSLVPVASSSQTSSSSSASEGIVTTNINEALRGQISMKFLVRSLQEERKEVAYSDFRKYLVKGHWREALKLATQNRYALEPVAHRVLSELRYRKHMHAVVAWYYQFAPKSQEEFEMKNFYNNNNNNKEIEKSDVADENDADGDHLHPDIHPLYLTCARWNPFLPQFQYLTEFSFLQSLKSNKLNARLEQHIGSATTSTQQQGEQQDQKEQQKQQQHQIVNNLMKMSDPLNATRAACYFLQHSTNDIISHRTRQRIVSTGILNQTKPPFPPLALTQQLARSMIQTAPGDVVNWLSTISLQTPSMVPVLEPLLNIAIRVQTLEEEFPSEKSIRSSAEPMLEECAARDNWSKALLFFHLWLKRHRQEYENKVLMTTNDAQKHTKTNIIKNNNKNDIIVASSASSPSLSQQQQQQQQSSDFLSATTPKFPENIIRRLFRQLVPGRSVTALIVFETLRKLPHAESWNRSPTIRLIVLYALLRARRSTAPRTQLLFLQDQQQQQQQNNNYKNQQQQNFNIDATKTILDLARDTVKCNVSVTNELCCAFVDAVLETSQIGSPSSQKQQHQQQQQLTSSSSSNHSWWLQALQMLSLKPNYRAAASMLRPFSEQFSVSYVQTTSADNSSLNMKQQSKENNKEEEDFFGLNDDNEKEKEVNQQQHEESKTLSSSSSSATWYFALRSISLLLLHQQKQSETNIVIDNDNVNNKKNEKEKDENEKETSTNVLLPSLQRDNDFPLIAAPVIELLRHDILTLDAFCRWYRSASPIHNEFTDDAIAVLKVACIEHFGRNWESRLKALLQNQQQQNISDNNNVVIENEKDSTSTFSDALGLSHHHSTTTSSASRNFQTTSDGDNNRRLSPLSSNYEMLLESQIRPKLISLSRREGGGENKTNDNNNKKNQENQQQQHQIPVWQEALQLCQETRENGVRLHLPTYRQLFDTLLIISKSAGVVGSSSSKAIYPQNLVGSSASHQSAAKAFPSTHLLLSAMREDGVHLTNSNDFSRLASIAIFRLRHRISSSSSSISSVSSSSKSRKNTNEEFYSSSSIISAITDCAHLFDRISVLASRKQQVVGTTTTTSSSSSLPLFIVNEATVQIFVDFISLISQEFLKSKKSKSTTELQNTSSNNNSNYVEESSSSSSLFDIVTNEDNNNNTREQDFNSQLTSVIRSWNPSRWVRMVLLYYYHFYFVSNTSSATTSNILSQQQQSDATATTSSSPIIVDKSSGIQQQPLEMMEPDLFSSSISMEDLINNSFEDTSSNTADTSNKNSKNSNVKLNLPQKDRQRISTLLHSLATITIGSFPQVTDESIKMFWNISSQSVPASVCRIVAKNHFERISSSTSSSSWESALEAVALAFAATTTKTSSAASSESSFSSQTIQEKQKNFNMLMEIAEIAAQYPYSLTTAAATPTESSSKSSTSLRSTATSQNQQQQQQHGKPKLYYQLTNPNKLETSSSTMPTPILLPLSLVARNSLEKYSYWLSKLAPPTSTTFAAIMDSCANANQWQEAIKLVVAVIENENNCHPIVFTRALAALPSSNNNSSNSNSHWDIALKMVSFLLQRQQQEINNHSKNNNNNKIENYSQNTEEVDDEYDDSSSNFDDGFDEDEKQYSTNKKPFVKQNSSSSISTLSTATNDLLWIDDAFLVSLVYQLGSVGRWRSALEAVQKTSTTTTTNVSSSSSSNRTVSIPVIDAISKIVPSAGQDVHRRVVGPLTANWSKNRGKLWKW